MSQDGNPMDDVNQMADQAQDAVDTVRSTKKAINAIKKIKTKIGGKGGKGAAKAAKGAKGAAAAGKAAAAPKFLIIFGILILILIVSDGINPSSTNNTSGGRVNEAQDRDYEEDKEHQKDMQDINKEMDEAEKMEDGEEKTKKIKEIQAKKDKLLRQYTMDQQFVYLAEIMVREAKFGYDLINAKYDQIYEQHAKDPNLNTHNNLEGQTIYQDPSSGLFYRRYEIDKWGNLHFFDQVEPRGNYFITDKSKEDMTNYKKGEGKDLGKGGPSTGIAYVVAAYHVSRGGTVPVGKEAGDAGKTYEYYKTFENILKQCHAKEFDYRDELKEKKAKQKVNVVRFKTSTILEKDNRDKSNTRTVEPLEPVEEIFEYNTYQYRATMSPYDIRQVLEKMFLENNEFYADVLATYDENYNGQGTAYIGTNITGNVNQQICAVKGSWPEKMDPKRITLVKQALSATSGYVKYVFGAAHSLSEASDPNQAFMDCSGFVGWSYMMSNIDIGIKKWGCVPSASRFKELSNVEAIKLNDLKPGDIVSSGSHLGMFVGRDSAGRQMYVHSVGQGDSNTEESPGPGPSFNGSFPSILYAIRAKNFNDDLTWEGTPEAEWAEENPPRTGSISRADETASKERNKELAKLQQENEEDRQRKFEDVYKDIDSMNSALFDPDKLPDLNKENPNFKMTDEEKEAAKKLEEAGKNEQALRDETVNSNAPGYKIAETEIKYIADLCYGSQNSKLGVAGHASTMLNSYEAYSAKNKLELTPDKLMEYIYSNGSKFGNGTSKDAPKEMVDIVRSVVVNGRRQAPKFNNMSVNLNDIKSAKNDGVDVGTDTSRYKRDLTVIEKPDGKTFVFYAKYGNIITGYTNRESRAVNEQFAFDYSNSTEGDPMRPYKPLSSDYNESGQFTNESLVANSKLDYIMNSPYYQWDIFYNYDCKDEDGNALSEPHPANTAFSCPKCGAKPKTYKKRIFLWITTTCTDYEFVKSELPDKVEKTSVNKDGSVKETSDDIIIVKRKIQMLADNMRNSIEKDLRKEDELHSVIPSAKDMIERVVLKYDAAGFDLDYYLGQNGQSLGYVDGYGYSSGVDSNGRLEAGDLIAEARRHVGENPDTSVYPHWGWKTGEWCAAFVTMCADNVGLTTRTNGKFAPLNTLNDVLDDHIMPRYTACKFGVASFNNNQLIRRSDSNYDPKPGDIVFLNTSERDNYIGMGKPLTAVTHVGIVVGTGTGDNIITIEGNTSGLGYPNYNNKLGAAGRVVAEKPREREQAVCFGVPPYHTEMIGGALTAETNNAKLVEVLARRGMSDAAIAGIFGNLVGEVGLDKNGQLNFKVVESNKSVEEVKKGRVGVGLCQWTGSRGVSFLKYLEQKGYTLKTAPFEVHLEYLGVELDAKSWGYFDHPDYAAALKQHNSPNKNLRIRPDQYKRIQDDIPYATCVFCCCFERPSTPRINVRIDGAYKALPYIHAYRASQRPNSENTSEN